MVLSWRYPPREAARVYERLRPFGLMLVFLIGFLFDWIAITLIVLSLLTPVVA